MRFCVSVRLRDACRKTPEAESWLGRLPGVVDLLTRRWSLTLATPFEGEDASCAWVVPAMRADGTAAVLKLAMPHFEGEHEIDGLRFWNGDPTVRLLESDPPAGAMLLERCEPGTALRLLPEPEQDLVIAGLLRRLWRSPAPPHRFRPLSAMLARWRDETIARTDRWSDAGLVREGSRAFEELSRSAPSDVLLATDLHAGNVLRARRESWLVIDPKPFIGDAAYDATQHLLNCGPRLLSDPDGTIRRFSDLLEVSHERVRLWTFARAAAVCGGDWDHLDVLALARALAP
jgi:streptomycin 6-kinase